MRSESDLIEELKAKMDAWIENGAQLAWLIDPYEQKVLVYRPGRPTDVVASERLYGEGPIAGFVLDLARVWKCYQD